MSKYDMRICKCGRIHMVLKEKIKNAVENNKNLLLICGGCGSIEVIGADVQPDWVEPDKNCYMMYTTDFSPYKDAIISISDFDPTNRHKGIDEIIYSHGLKVPMKTGEYATSYSGGWFADMICPDFWKSSAQILRLMRLCSLLKSITPTE